VKKGSSAGCSDERLFASFVVGAPAYLNKNISSEATELGIHNGTRCVLHSIGYKTPRQQQLANDAISQCAIGAVVWVEPPDFVVVDIGARPDIANAPRSATGNVLFTLCPGEMESLNVVVTSPPNEEAASTTRLSCVTIQTFDVDLTWSVT
jgi:hypothetical protein